MQVKGLAHIGIRVRDMDVSVKFYTELLGFKVTGRQMLGTTELCFLENGSCPLELIHSATHDERVPGQIDHFALEVQHIDELVEGLKAKGITFLTDGVVDCPTLMDGVRNIFFCGPDGERIEFFDYVNRY